MNDPYVYLPGVFGFVLGLIQISLKVVYKDKSKSKLSPDLNSAEMKLS
jgi:hypothetical protein